MLKVGLQFMLFASNSASLPSTAFIFTSETAHEKKKNTHSIINHSISAYVPPPGLYQSWHCLQMTHCTRIIESPPPSNDAFCAGSFIWHCPCFRIHVKPITHRENTADKSFSSFFFFFFCHETRSQDSMYQYGVVLPWHVQLRQQESERGDNQAQSRSLIRQSTSREVELPLTYNSSAQCTSSKSTEACCTHPSAALSVSVQHRC